MLVIEILDQQTTIPNDSAGEFFFKDLAESNGVSSTDDMAYTALPDEEFMSGEFPLQSVVCIGKGLQKIAKGQDYDVFGNLQKSQEASWVSVELGLLRLDNVKTDLLVTLSSPNESNPQDTTTTATTSALFRSIFCSLRIRDWGLFG